MSQLRDQAISKLPTTCYLLPATFDSGLLVAALLALFAIFPLLAYPGLPNTADGPVHLMRQAELNQAWQDGILYPRWAPDLAYGYGMPLFHYAPPLLYHLTQLIHLTGLLLDASMKGILILMMLLYSLGMYLFARDLFGPRAGLLAAATYLYTPYRLREAYIQGNYGQFCGLAFYPLILWSFHGLMSTRQARYLPLAALSLAGLLLSHNISTMIFAPLLGGYLVFLWAAARGIRKLDNRAIGRSGDQELRPPASLISDSLTLRVIIAIVLGLGLSAFFWLPAFGERDLIRLVGITTGFFDFRYNFISLTELLASPRPLDLSAINPHYPLSLGLAQMVFAVLAVLGLGLHCLLRNAQCRGVAQYSPGAHHVSLRSGQRGSLAVGHMLFFGAALLVSAFLTLPYSQPIWEAMPLLELAEFPWRWLGPANLCAALLAGAALYLFERLVAGSRKLAAGSWGLGLGLCFTLAANLFYLFPAQFIPWGTPAPADVLAYEAQSGAIGTTSAGEFLPRWADRYPSPEVLGPEYVTGRLPTKLDPASLPEGATATTLVHTARETQVAVSSPVPFTATFRALYWPGWRVMLTEGVNGDVYPLTGQQVTWPDGLIRADLPAGEYLVSLRLFPTPIRSVATMISILSAVILLGLITACLVGWKIGRSVRRSPAGTEGQVGGPLQPQSACCLLPASHSLVIGAGLVVGLLVTRPMAKWFQVQSPLDIVYQAQHMLRADFGDQVRLLAFDLPTCEGEPPLWGKIARWEGGDLPANCSSLDYSELPKIQVEAGGSLPVVLYWRALAPLVTDYSTFVHLDAPDGGTYASADELNPEDIPTSHWPPSLYLRNALSLSLPPELPTIRYTLTAGLYDSQSRSRLPVAGCDGCPRTGDVRDVVPLAYVWLSSPRPLAESDIPRRLDYRLGDKITLLGYELSTTDPAMLTLYWRSEVPLEVGYAVFIHALGPDGEVLAQFDAPPLSGLYPTDAWLPGQIIPDAHSVPWPGSTRTLAVGLYDPGNLARLRTTDASGGRIPDDAIRLQLEGSP